MSSPARGSSPDASVDELRELVGGSAFAGSVLDAIDAESAFVADHRLRIVAPPALAGRHVRDALPRGSFAAVEPLCHAALRGESGACETAPGAGAAHHTTDTSPIRSPAGEVIGVLLLTRDITQRVRESQTSAYVLRQRQQAFEQTSRGVVITDGATQTMLYVNPAFAVMHGGEVADFIGQAFDSVLSAGWRAQAPVAFADADAAGFARLESEHVRLDGSVFPVDVEVVTTNGPDGPPLTRISWYEDLSGPRAAEVALRATTDMFEAAFTDAPNGVAVIGLDAHFLRVNAALCVILGRTEEDLVGLSIATLSHPDDAALTTTAYAELATGTEPVTVEKRYLRPDGEIVLALCRGITIRDEHGTGLYIVTHFQDITERERLEREEAAATERFEHAFADAPIGMALVALDGRFMRVNRMLCEITGFDESELMERTFQQGSHPDDEEAAAVWRAKLVSGEVERYTAERRYYTAKRNLIWIKIASSLLRDADGEPAHFIVQMENVSERKRLEASLHRLADNDALTGLWNRRRFEVELRTQVARCQRYGERAALLMIDLDGFKPINDRFGHKAGDEMLQLVAGALRHRLRSTDALARVGGDEFLVLLTNVSPDQAALLAEGWRAAVESVALERAGETVGVSASVGIAFLDENVDGLDEAMLRADTAMYDAKALSMEPGRARTELQARVAAALHQTDGDPVIRVLHCADAGPYRRLIEDMLRAQPDIVIAASASTAQDALDGAQACRPDVILLDANLPGGDDQLLALLRLRAPAARITVLSDLGPEDAPLAAAADGFIGKAAGFDELADAIRATAAVAI